MQEQRLGIKNRLKRLSLGASLLALGVIASPALAADATPEGAKQLQDQLARYLTPAAFESGVMTVTPQGGAYALKIDMSMISQAAAAKGDAFTFEPYTYLITPKDDGTYDVSSNSPLSLSAKSNAGEKAFEFKLGMTDCEATGVFDPKLGSFSDMTSGCGKGEFVMHTAAEDVDATYGEIKTTTKSVAADGGTTVTISSDIAGVTESISVKQGQPFQATLKAGAAKQEVVFAGARITNVLDLVAFLVQTGGPEKALAAQQDIKDKLLAALPLWTTLGGNVVFSDVSIETPIGVVKAASFSEGIGLSGATKDASYSIGIKLAGLELPEGLVPGWAAPLVPKEGNIDMKLSGADLDALARLAITSFDATKNPPIPNELQGQFMALLLGGQPKVTLSPSKLTADKVEIGASGEMSVFPSQAGKVTVTATNLDAVTDAITNSDMPNKEQALMGLTMVKGMGKAGADGSTVWEVEFDVASKKVLVNGQPLPM